MSQAVFKKCKLTLNTVDIGVTWQDYLIIFNYYYLLV